MCLSCTIFEILPLDMLQELHDRESEYIIISSS